MFSLPEDRLNEVKRLGDEQGCTLFMTLLTIFQVLLHRYTGQTDIVVGTPIVNRHHVETEGLIGLFLNTLVLRTDCKHAPSFTELLRQVKETTLNAYMHQDLPFEQLVEHLNVTRDLGRHPLFQVMFVLLNVDEPDLSFDGLEAESVDVENPLSKFDLTLWAEEKNGTLKLGFEYSIDLFEKPRIVQMAKHFLKLIEGVVLNPNQSIAQFPLLDDEELHQQIVRWNNNQIDFPVDTAIHELFEAQFKRTPNALAVVSEKAQLTYAEINQRSNQLANYLRSQGIEQNIRVGICVDRSVNMVVGLLGILKAGGAYVPLDPTYPPARLAFMLKDAQVTMLVTQQQWLDRLPFQAVPTVCLDADRELISESNGDKPEGPSGSKHLAYVIYTSGSTGDPKGVAITHQNAVAMLTWVGQTFDQSILAGTLASTSISFDLSVFEIFGPLSFGGIVILAENFLALSDLKTRKSVTLCNTVPSAMNALLQGKGLPESVRVVNLAGEILSRRLVQRVYENSKVEQVFNLYGPSECTTYSLVSLIDRDAEGEPLIGKPIANTSAYILDSELKPLPIGVVGELYLGGAGVAAGYLERPDLTAAKFVADPFVNEPGVRLYATGDLARFLPDGNIEFLGRKDRQVKLRGFRIELPEIEAFLGECENIREVVVVARELQPGDKQLIAYLVSDVKPRPSEAELKDRLKFRLPSYMMPSVFVWLDALPLTTNGKVNHRALPAPGSLGVRLLNDATPETALEKSLTAIWADILKLERVGVNENFFDVGGHSLLMTQLQVRIQENLGDEISVVDLFKYPTIRQLARYLSSLRSEKPTVVISEIETRALRQKKALQKQRKLHQTRNTNEFS